jgi:hypothetical protein
VAAVLAAVLPLAATVPQDDPVLRFVDVAAEAGLHLLNVSGSREKDDIVESNGNGAAFFDYDYDNDGDVSLPAGLAATMGPYLGLGGAARVDRLVIRWPSGLRETVTELVANRFYVAREGTGVRPGP